MSRSHKRPKRFDYNLIVIGAGSAGLVSAYIASTLKAKVALIEKHKMGGDCLNTGCVPSKSLIRSAKVVHYAQRAQEFGLKSGHFEFDFAEVMDRVHKVIKKVEPHDSVERYTSLGVDCIQGAAHILSPFEVEVNDQRLTARAIIVATGARPFVPPLPGLKATQPLTSDNLWNLRHLPRRLVVLGSGPIGCELAQSFSRFGSEVTMIEMGPRIMSKEDADVAELVQNRLEREGLKILTNHKAKEVRQLDGQKQLVAEWDGREVIIDFDEILVATGRKANVQGFGLEELGVKVSSSGTIDHDEFLATNHPNIFVCGDVAGPFQFTHTAAHQAYFACINALFHPILRWLPPALKGFGKADYSVIPWATYTDPEVATVGLTETSAKKQGIVYELTTYGIDDLDRAMAEEEDYGLVKVLTQPGQDKILGATIVGAHASELITEFIAAMKHGYGLNSILGTIHIYPTLSEANKFAAGNWKKARKPEGALRWLKAFFAWLRGGS